MKRLPFRRRLTLWSTLVAAVSIAICGAGAAWFVHQGEVAQIDDELRTNSLHFFSELERHGLANFDWRRIDHEMGEWLPQRASPDFIEIRTGNTLRWRSSNLPSPGFESQAVGLSAAQIRGKALRLYVAEKGGGDLRYRF